MHFQVVNCPSQDLALTNCAFVSPSEYSEKCINSPYIELNDIVLFAKPHDNIQRGQIGLNGVQRKHLRVSTGDEIQAHQFQTPGTSTSGGNDGENGDFNALMMTMELEFTRPQVGQVLVQNGKHEDVDAKKMHGVISRTLTAHVFTVGQKFAIEFCGNNYLVTVGGISNDVMQLVEGDDEVDERTSSNNNKVKHQRGLFTSLTTLIFESAANSGIKISGQKSSVMNSTLFKSKEFSFEKLGIGGLDKQFEDIFRRAFSSRIFPQSVVQRLGITHVKGMLLHGPPGTGKTLIARQIGKMLNGKEPKVVNGPEVMSKYVGQSEENIRALFADAEAEYKQKGDDSELHIIIFDEIDAVCKSRGSVNSGTGVHDSIVNQLLTKIDGVDALNNILLIGMTNRKDMLDEAILRPGRLEVHIEIGLPDEAGRAQILKIHSNKMSENKFLSKDVDVSDLAKKTQNYSGAEIEGLVKSAVSFALTRHVNVADITAEIDEDNIKVTKEDFDRAFSEVVPAFGAATETFERCRLNGMISYGSRFEKLLGTSSALVEQVRVSEKTPKLACLLEGGVGCGKTALAATLAMNAEFPFMKIVSADSMIGHNEMSKVQTLAKVFDDAYKSNLSLLVLDDLERLLEYVSIGPRFSNVVLQALLVLIKRQPPKGKKLLVIGTTSNKLVLDDMGLTDAFDATVSVPSLTTDEATAVIKEIEAFRIEDVDAACAMLDHQTPIKKLFVLLELARHGRSDHDVMDDANAISLDRWINCMEDLST
ncbi:unnamed protein product [Bathycoccus prasinos]